MLRINMFNCVLYFAQPFTLCFYLFMLGSIELFLVQASELYCLYIVYNFSQLVNYIVYNFSQLVNCIVYNFSQLVNYIVYNFSQLVNYIVYNFSQLVNYIVYNFSQLVNYIVYILFIISVNWLDLGKTLREQGIDQNEILLLRRKFFFSDQNVDARDPIQLNLLYVQVNEFILFFNCFVFLTFLTRN